MELTGKQKAAMLLMSLDSSTATELLRDVEPKQVQDLAVEYAYLDASGLQSKEQSLSLAREFCGSLRKGHGLNVKSFLNEMLKSTMGQENAEQLQNKIQNLLVKRDPFLAIRSADAETLALILRKEHPQAIAVVLSELDSKKSADILAMFNEAVQVSVISRLTNAETVTAEAKSRIAEMVENQLKSVTDNTQNSAGRTNQPLRKVAVMLRNLGKEIRDGLLKNMAQKDLEVAKTVLKLMIIWEDIPQVANSSLQQAIRIISPQKLALALVGADAATTNKIKSNISERVSALLAEQASLISAANKTDVYAAREELVRALRKMNGKGDLIFA
ncbi:FliG C-terminal domain-containing protein [Planctomycetota bacterium]